VCGGGKVIPINFWFQVGLNVAGNRRPSSKTQQIQPRHSTMTSVQTLARFFLKHGLQIQYATIFLASLAGFFLAYAPLNLGWGQQQSLCSCARTEYVSVAAADSSGVLICAYIIKPNALPQNSAYFTQLCAYPSPALETDKPSALDNNYRSTLEDNVNQGIPLNISSCSTPVVLEIKENSLASLVIPNTSVARTCYTFPNQQCVFRMYPSDPTSTVAFGMWKFPITLPMTLVVLSWMSRLRTTSFPWAFDFFQRDRARFPVSKTDIYQS
jgi:hypothetical protein